MEVEGERGLVLYFQFFVIFSKKLKQTITHPLLVFSVLLFYISDAQRPFVALQFGRPMAQNPFNLVK
jgi:hypothetical protein